MAIDDDEGSFSNYVDQILPDFDPQPPSSGQKWTFYILSTLCHVTPDGLYTDPPPAQWGESRFIAKLLQILSIESHDLTSF